MSAPTGSVSHESIPQIRFAQARGARIAYQDFGSGPAVVAVPPFAQNIEAAWEWPGVRAMFERYGSFCRFINHDKRGTGASDRHRGLGGLDERVEDLRAVMDDAEVDRAFLFGASEGGPMCLLFAATYPDRVEGVILNGSGAYIVPPEDVDPEARAAFVGRAAYLADTWGTPESPMADAFSPSLAGDVGYRSWLERYCRLSADRESVRDLLAMIAEVDVREVLADISAPVLVQHRTGDLVVPADNSRVVADAIAGAELVEYTGNDHFSFVGDQTWLDDIERFVTGTVQPRPPRPRSSAAAIRTLGGFGVTIDGQEVPTGAWGSRLPRQLCKRLVAARGWPVTREQLFDLLWPDEADTTKLGARLSVQLSAVRRVLGGGVIADRQMVALNLQEVTTDIEELHRAGDDEQIVAIYAGEFLPEDLGADWTAGTRDEARSRFTAAAHRLAVAASEAGDHLGASGLARRLIDDDRYDEQAHRLNVYALLAAGDTAGARRAHRRWVDHMAEIDIDVPPFRPG